MANRISILLKLSNLILYSSLLIAICAASLVTFTYDVTGSAIGTDAYVGFVFCGTLVIYAMHRLAGIERVKAFEYLGRFAVIKEHRSHIMLYGIMVEAGAIYFLFHLSMQVIWWLVLPGVVSFMYVVPLKSIKRWRDYSFVKIFLIATVWAALT